MDTNEERKAQDEASMEQGGKYSQPKILQRKVYNFYSMKHSSTFTVQAPSPQTQSMRQQMSRQIEVSRHNRVTPSSIFNKGAVKKYTSDCLKLFDLRAGGISTA